MRDFRSERKWLKVCGRVDEDLGGVEGQAVLFTDVVTMKKNETTFFECSFSTVGREAMFVSGPSAPLAPEALTAPQSGRQCQHKDQTVSRNASECECFIHQISFFNDILFVCSFEFRDKKPADETKAPEHLCVSVSWI